VSLVSCIGFLKKESLRSFIKSLDFNFEFRNNNCPWCLEVAVVYSICILLLGAKGEIHSIGGIYED
ncbi:hypothetical protein HMPREF1398_01193, partial [Helicobacter pylori GAM117Ai]